MSRIVLRISFISLFIFFILISLNSASLEGKAYAEEDQAIPMPSQLPQLPRMPDIEDRIHKDIDSNDAVSIGQGRIIGENEVVHDAVVIGADLTVNGTVNGDAVCIGGDLTVGPQAEIKGDIVNIGGQLTVDPLARTYGERVNIGGIFPFGIFKGKKGTNSKGSSEGFGMFIKILRLTVDSASFILLLFLAFLMTTFMPRQFGHIEEYLTNEFPRCTLLGIACMIGLPIVIVLFIISLVGILAVPFLLLAILVSCMMGYVVFSRVLGRKILVNSPVMLQILIGLLLLHSPVLAGDIVLFAGGSVFSIIGHVLRGIGIIIAICVHFIGLGAVVYSVWGTRGVAQVRGDKPNSLSSMSGGANTPAA